MRVERVEIFELRTGLSWWHPVVIRVHTDEGVTGVGEVGMPFGVGHTAAASMVRELCEAFVLGVDPFRTEWLWEEMFRNSFWAQGGGPVVFGAMSALDVALWDIKGKVLGVPVYQLLGGRTRDRLRAYAAHIQYGWGQGLPNLVLPAEYARAAEAAVRDGYDCIKLDPVEIDAGGGVRTDWRGLLERDAVRLCRERVEAMRDAVGSDVDIIIDVHSYTSLRTATQLGRIWEDLGCIYYEEPVSYMNRALQEGVRRRLGIPMAAGERLYTRWGFREFLEKQSLDVIQPDLGLTGGITEGKKVCDYAAIYDVGVQLHVCGTPISTAAALQVEAVIPNFLIHEHHCVALEEKNREICLQDHQPRAGVIDVPDAPGLGVELNDEVVYRSPHVVVERGV